MTTPQISPAPPTAQVLADVLVTYDFDGSLPAVAMFLAAPANVAPGINAGSDGTSMWMRGHTVVVDETATVADIATAAAELAALTHTPADTYLDLSGAPEGWFKLLTSGTRRVAFGVNLLWGAPKISAGVGVEPGDVAGFVAGWRSGVVDFPMLLMTEDRPVTVEGTPKRVTLTSLLAEPTTPVEVSEAGTPAHARARAAAEDLSRVTGGELVSVSPADGPGRWSAGLKLEGTYVLVEFELSAGTYRAARWPGRDGVPSNEAFFMVAGHLVHTATGLICKRP